MEFWFIILIGASMASLAWILMLPFSQFRRGLRRAASWMAALSEGCFLFFARLALSESLGLGRRNRFRPTPHEVSHVRRFIVAACAGTDPRAAAGKSDGAAWI